MIDIDKISMLVTVDTDYSIQEIEKQLNREGFTLNYYAIPNNEVLMVDVLNDRIPNLYSHAYGGIEDLCAQVKLAQADGSVYSNVLTPRSATGPSLKKMAIGSGEMLGIPIQASLKIFHKPALVEVACLCFSDVRSMEYFIQAVRKNSIPVALMCQFSKKNIEVFFEGFGEGSVVLGLALWGERDLVDGYCSYLRDLVLLKHGDWVDVEKGRVKSKLLEALHEESVRLVQRKISSSEQNLSPSHRKMMKLIEGMA